MQIIDYSTECNSAPSWEFINSLANDFPGLHDYYSRYWLNVPVGQILSSSQHALMASHYRTTMVQMLKQFDQNLTTETAEALAWTGLIGSLPIDLSTGFRPDATQAWKDLTPEERTNIASVLSNYKINTPPCQ